MKVLVADDSPTTRFRLRKSLIDWGYDVVEAADGKEALAVLLAPEPPRVAVLDWMMPELDGIQVCQRLKEREGEPLIYTILLTSKTAKENLIEALEQGAHDFQSKPADPGELRARIAVGCRLIEADDKVKEYADRMQELSRTDDLTGVCNRRHIMALAEKEIARCRRYGRTVSVLLLDIDHFKHINDTYGHAAGDEVLKALAKSCTAALRVNDLLGRIGGEEFAVLLPETDTPGAIATAERLRQTASSVTVPAGPHDIRLTISIGVTALRETDGSFNDLLCRSDQALYKAKDSGRDCVVAL